MIPYRSLPILRASRGRAERRQEHPEFGHRRSARLAGISGIQCWFWTQGTSGINDVLKESLPPSLSGTVLEGLGGPPNPIVVVGSTLSASACVAHSCPDKGFFSLWGCDGGADIGLRCELLLGSRRIASFQNIPASGKQALMEWLNEYGIRVKVVRFIDAGNKTTELDPAEFHLTERFYPPSTGPSFDCEIARSQIEKAICGNPTLAKLDLEMADLYRQMYVGSDTVGYREQLRALQRAWLARRRAACPDKPDQVPCVGGRVSTST
jgi:hypothetical protein